MLSFIARSIAAKVAVAFSFVIVTLVVSYIVMAQRLDTIGKAMDNVTEISNYSTSIIRINKDIIEMQRDVSVYSLSGSDAVFDKIKESFRDIKVRLNALSDSDILNEEHQYIESLSKLVAQLGGNLKDLSSLYKSRSSLIDVVLENIYQSAIKELYVLEQNTSNVREKLKIVELTNNWHTLHRNAWLFLSKKDYYKRQEVNTILRKMTSIHLINQSEASIKLQKLAKDYQKSFIKSIQVNRNYFNLVNVVMAGNAIEFGNLANMLREHSLSRLKKIKERGHESISTTENILNLLGIAIILYLIFLAFFFHLYITKAITRLTISFSRFLSGDLSAPINHTHRADEIGVLAQAASRFRDMSKDLEKEKQAAERTSKVKSEFLANMSHEIRTPMNGILGMAIQLSNTNLAAPQKEMLDIITSSGESLLVIINDILDLSKIEADKIELEKRPIDLNALLKSLEVLFQGQANTKGIRLSVQTFPINEEIVFLGDETRIRQILMNLLGNAIKFTDQGEVTLTARIKVDLGKRLVLLFSVTDTGIGIEPNNIEKLFDAFSQADTSITRKFGGTGLGLTITSKLLHLMGAELKVESEEKKGSRFFFEIETEKGIIETPKIQPEKNENQSENIDYSSFNILVAEDNKTNQVVMRGFLSNLKIASVIVAEDGDQAVNLCENHVFDLIFMDMQMPIKDGLQATIEIKKMNDYRDVPIIALTANVFEDDKIRCAEAGMCDFVGKPISFPQLESVIKKWSKTS
ncbi:Aerobic respiration control sensor protein ArcB [Marinomonas spartinae]|uniref:ATP-binding protein n=1 Tax=Marinomonas spartinae TaxID=1792290 RepID=UPI000808C1BE|nr:ATP-binding protein [Marinomonas spartinae]SBS38911.1 Aerobic respiration control sensor protein ArcB [Marinomonas spartinae]